ncbi:MAG: DUF262 domain-containing protein [Roseiarcus sp.]
MAIQENGSSQAIAVKSTPWKVRSLAQLKGEKRLHLPDLQRGFVWSPERVRTLFDSLYRRYPIGALLLWKPTWDGPEAPFETRAWDLAPPSPSDERGVKETVTTIEAGSIFILDGQQRLTSLFSVLFSSREYGKTVREPNLMVSLSNDPEWARQPFHLYSRDIAKRQKAGLLIHADILFEGVRGSDESVAISKAIGDWVKVDNPLFFKALDQANRIRTAILEAEVVAYEIDADADDDSVIEIFARLNQQGVRLKPGDLAAARLTGKMKSFRSLAKGVLTQDSLKGFAAIEGEDEAPRSGAFVDTDLAVRTALFLSNNVVKYREVEERADSGKAYEKISGSWDAASKGLSEAVSIFKNAGIPSGSWIQYRYVLLPPAIWHARGHQREDEFWLAWTVLSCLWGQYSGSAETQVQADAVQARDASMEGLLNNVRNRAKRTESLIPDFDDFRQQIVQERGVTLGLLLHLIRTDAASLPNGKLIGAKAEPLEVHHLFPRAYLNKNSSESKTFQADRLGNLTIVYRADNEFMCDAPPGEYLADSPDETLRHHCIPLDRSLWSLNTYEEFCEERERLLADGIGALLRSLGIKDAEVS